MNSNYVADIQSTCNEQLVSSTCVRQHICPDTSCASGTHVAGQGGLTSLAKVTNSQSLLSVNNNNNNNNISLLRTRNIRTVHVIIIKSNRNAIKYNHSYCTKIMQLQMYDKRGECVRAVGTWPYRTRAVGR